MNTKWEYLVETIYYEKDIAPTLNRVGKYGWELVVISNNTEFIFKRKRIQDPDDLEDDE